MININGENWEILLVSPSDPLLRLANGHYAVGVCDDNIKVIAINQELNDFYLKKVLCHELTHAAMFSYNVELNLEQEELVADLMATYGQEIMNKTNTVFKRIS